MRTLRLFATAAVVFAAVILTGAPMASAAPNLVTNPGFETGGLSGWGCTAASVVGAPVHTGSHALAGAASAADYARCAQTVAVQSGARYTLSAWVRGAYVHFGVTGGAATWTPAAGDWTRLTVTFTAGGGSVEIYLHGWYGQGTYHADEVTLEGPGSPPGNPTVPPTPRGLTVAVVTDTSVTLHWEALVEATGYHVYRDGTRVLSPTGPAATVTGLSANTTYAFAVSATNSTGESPRATVSATTSGPGGGGSPRSWPYIDITRDSPTLPEVARATGQKHFTLAFVLGDSTGCNPSWGGTIPLTEPRIVTQIQQLKAMGGDVTVAFGGALGPYLEASCGSVAALAGAYKRVIDTLGVRHLDIDIEASVPIDQMNKALAQVQRERPGTSVAFTLMVQSDDYGLTPALGVDLLRNAKANGVNVAVVNPMTMEFGSSRANWGDAVVAAAQSTLRQMAEIWPEKTDAQRRRMLGVTPMIGRNFNGRVFTQAHGRQLVAWANSNHVGLLAFWSVGRDNGGCPGGGVSPSCSSIPQTPYEFTRIFGGFTG